MEKQLIIDDSLNCMLLSFANAYVFEKRAKKFDKYVSFIKVFGLLVPVSVGLVAMGYGFDNILFKKVLVVAVPFSIAQFILSVLSITYNWDEELTYSYEAAQAYTSLWQKWHALNQSTEKTDIELKTEYDLLKAEAHARGHQDRKHRVMDWEMRRGLRWAWMINKLPCTVCGAVPVNMWNPPKKCDGCGNFKERDIFNIFRS